MFSLPPQGTGVVEGDLNGAMTSKTSSETEKDTKVTKKFNV